MAKLKLQGSLDVYEISNQDAESIKHIWMSDAFAPTHKIAVEDLSFEKRKITFIQTYADETGEGRLNLNDSIDYQKAKEFQKMMNAWFEEHPVPHQTHQHYLQEQGIMRYDKEPRVSNFDGNERWLGDQGIVLDPKRYIEFSKLWNAYNELGYLKEKQNKIMSIQILPKEVTEIFIKQTQF